MSATNKNTVITEVAFTFELAGTGERIGTDKVEQLPGRLTGPKAAKELAYRFRRPEVKTVKHLCGACRHDWDSLTHTGC